MDPLIDPDDLLTEILMHKNLPVEHQMGNNLQIETDLTMKVLGERVLPCNSSEPLKTDLEFELSHLKPQG